jgi:phosphate starvation-inducible PhoH-like protein
MAKLKRANAKRSDRPNRREDRNYGTNYNDNVITVDSFRQKTRKIEITPRNVAQEDYIDYLEDDNINIVFGIGPAGTGKTYIAALYAVKALMEKKVDRIVIMRPAVCTDEQHGFLPGDLNSKLGVWVKNVVDVLKEYYSVQQIERMLEEEVIELAALAYLRGRTFKNSVIICDEAQNTTSNQMKMLLTRIGDGSKIIVTGDIEQSDKNFHNNGLKDFISRFDKSEPEGIAVAEFMREDVVRHKIIESVLEMYGDEVL